MKLILISIFVIQSCLICAQTDYWSFVNPQSALEKVAWEKNDPLSFFMSINPDISIQEAKEVQNRLYTFCATQRYNPNANQKREMERLYHAIHDRFLRKYEKLTDFPTTMSTGIYNCVSASMLYALILDIYQIPYAIVEAPEHVFLIAFPETEYIILETTSPNFRSFQLSKPKTKGLVYHGISSKLLLKKEVDEKGLFLSYEEGYTDWKRTNMHSLIGMQISNKLFKAQDENSEKTLELVIKMRALNFHLAFEQELVPTIMNTLIARNGLDEEGRFTRLWMGHLKSKTIPHEELMGFHEYLLYHNLTKNSNSILSWADFINQQVESDSVKERMKKTYLEFRLRHELERLHEYGDSLFLNLDLVTDIEHLQLKLKAVDSENELVKGLLMEKHMKAFEEQLNRFDFSEAGACVDSINALKLEIKPLYFFQQAENQFLRKVHQLFREGKISLGKSLLQKYETLVYTYPMYLGTSTQEWGYTYAFWADALENQGQMSASKAVLRKGYSKFPDHEYLVNRYKSAF